MNREELAWAAGFFDGEGWVGLHNSRTQPDQAIIRVGQKDRRARDRFRAAVGVGSVLGPYGPYRNTQIQMFIYQVGGFHQVQAVCAMLWEWLCPIKRQQFASSLSRARRANTEGWNAQKGTCIRGHALSGDNIIITRTRYGHRKRQCRACKQLEGYRRGKLYKTAHALLVAI